jgi:deazaflavin-dependent oxidoreductase (nitroreductase family)
LWYENLVNNPEVEIQVGAEVAIARASTITDQLSYERNWKMMVGIWPGFDEYKAKTSRVIPLVAIRPH